MRGINMIYVFVSQVNGGWAEWTVWGSCSVSCGEGWRRRTRRCNNPPPSNSGADCEGTTYEDQLCSTVPCPLDGHWLVLEQYNPK